MGKLLEAVLNFSKRDGIKSQRILDSISTLAKELNQPSLPKEYIFVLFLKVFEDRLYLNKLVLFKIEGELLPVTAFRIPLAALL